MNNFFSDLFALKCDIKLNLFFVFRITFFTIFLILFPGFYPVLAGLLLLLIISSSHNSIFALLLIFLIRFLNPEVVNSDLLFPILLWFITLAASTRLWIALILRQ
jgi:hypothetical protein